MAMPGYSEASARAVVPPGVADHQDAMHSSREEWRHHEWHVPFASGQRGIGAVDRLVGDAVIEAHDGLAARLARHLDELIGRLALGEGSLRLLDQAGREDEEHDDHRARDHGRAQQERD